VACVDFTAHGMLKKSRLTASLKKIGENPSAHSELWF